MVGRSSYMPPLYKVYLLDVGMWPKYMKNATFPDFSPKMAAWQPEVNIQTPMYGTIINLALLPTFLNQNNRCPDPIQGQ